uniref:SasC/FmtB family protein n=4 Tax=Staphylococcus TaxID=1279 RepID=UPI000A4EACF2
MNIFKKQKFSIRKFTVGTFSTVIATLAFITHSGHAQAAEDVHQPNVADKQTVGANQTEGTPNSNASVTTTLNDSTTNQANNLVAANSSETTASINDHTTQPSKQEEKHETTQSKPLTVVNNQPSGTDRSIGEDRASNSNESEGDPMALNEQNTSGIINGDFEDTSNGASIPTNETEAAMNSATTVTGWHVKDSAQTEIPLVWGPKALSTYNGQTFNLTTHKIGAVLSKSTDNSNANQRVPQVGPIYQDIDVTPGSEVQLNFIGQSMGNTNGLNGVKVYIYDANNPTDLLYKGAPSTHNFAFGKFTGVFNVPDDVTKLRIMFESADGRSHDTYNGHRLLKGANNFGGGVVADVSLNSGSYLKTVNTTNDYKEVVTTDHETTVESTVNVDLENKGHSRAQNAVYKVTLPEGADYVSVFNANGSYDSATRVLSLSLGYIRPEEIRHFSYTVRLDATRPLRKEFNSTFTYNTEGLYMNKRDFRGDIGNNNFEGYRQFGGVNEFVKETTPRHEGNGTGEVQSITVKMFKNDLQAKVNKLEQLNEADYTPEVWAEMKEVLTHAKAILAETDDTPLDERKDQAEINATTLNLAKQADILAMDKVVVEKYAIIKNNAEFTVEERVNNRKKIKDFFDAAKGIIVNANNTTKADDAMNNGLRNINGVELVPIKKSYTKLEIDGILMTKEGEIDQVQDATDEEKAEARTQAEAAAQKGKSTIDRVPTNGEVDDAKNLAETEINAVQVAVVKKPTARQTLEHVASTKKATIDQTPDATQEEKDAAKGMVDDALRAAKEQIDQVTSNSQVDDAVTQGTTNINEVVAIVIKKNDARQTIDGTATTKKESLQQTPDATQEEIDVAKAKVDVAVNDAKANINSANTNGEVDTASNNGVDTINAIQVEVAKKSQARQAIDDAATAKKATIDQTPDATQEEKDAAKQKVDAAVTEAKANISTAVTN